MVKRYAEIYPDTSNMEERNDIGEWVRYESYEALEKEVAALKRNEEWICENCRIVHPGIPKPNSINLTCENCGKGLTIPRPLFEKRELESRLAEACRVLEEMLSEKFDWKDGEVGVGYKFRSHIRKFLYSQSPSPLPEMVKAKDRVVEALKWFVLHCDMAKALKQKSHFENLYDIQLEELIFWITESKDALAAYDSLTAPKDAEQKDAEAGGR